MIEIGNDYLKEVFDNEELYIEPWGNDSLRIRSFADRKVFNKNFALLDKPQITTEVITKKNKDGSYSIQNGNIRAVLDHRNRLTFYDKKNNILLKEYIRLRAVKHDDGSEDVGTVEFTKDFNSTLKLKSREYKANFGGDFESTVRFEADKEEKIFGMGQYQEDFLDLKGATLELAQRNTQMSVPFYISNKGYGFLWNNPGIGRVTFAKNITEWHMYSTYFTDYWITAGETPKEITKNYSNVTGTAPHMPEHLLGLWQSKLRYRTSDEVLDVVKEYERRGISLSTIAIDYFHWPKQGEYRFDLDYWKDPKELVRTLKEKYGVEPLISIWPTVQSDAENYNEYLERGYLVQVNRGVRITMQIQGSTVFIDTTNKEACDYVWQRIKRSYKDIGIDYYWIDVAEPGYSVYDFDNYRYSQGTDLQCGNLYPIGYLKMIYDGNDGDINPVVTLVRGAWAGAQRLGALAWSGDVDSSFKSLRNQVNSGLNMGLAGIPWWTTDIGGFHGGIPEDKDFRELMIRWFQYATFSPILRMHGDRLPHEKPLSRSGGGSMPTGAPNEIWSYGNTVEKILTKYIKIREFLKDYLNQIFEEAHNEGYPLMRALFYEFPQDRKAWEIENTYMLGPDLLIAPILYERTLSRDVYLPEGTQWIDIFDLTEYEGGRIYKIAASIEKIPVFVKKESLDSFTSLIEWIRNSK